MRPELIWNLAMRIFSVEVQILVWTPAIAFHRCGD
jgi:hypothetical protein